MTNRPETPAEAALREAHEAANRLPKFGWRIAELIEFREAMHTAINRAVVEARKEGYKSGCVAPRDDAARAAVEEAMRERIGRAFREGNTEKCPYSPDDPLSVWWWRGFLHMSRLLRAVHAEKALHEKSAELASLREEVVRDNAEIAQLRERLEKAEATAGDLPETIKQALNSGDGTYKP